MSLVSGGRQGTAGQSGPPVGEFSEFSVWSIAGGGRAVWTPSRKGGSSTHDKPVRVPLQLNLTSMGIVSLAQVAFVPNLAQSAEIGTHVERIGEDRR